MLKMATWKCFIVLFFACLANSQTCPPNTAMGLCETVDKPCVADSECSNGEICCPQACSRSCKPRSRGSVPMDVSVPDLLNDPRVYVGKCPDASCYNPFGGETDECSTSNLCPRGKYCCSDGCRNVCQMTPEWAARIAQEETRAKKQQIMIIQKQQEEMRRRQQEMILQRQRQIATAERARQQAEARAAAEAELAAQHARAKYESELRAAAHSNARGTQQQRVVNVQPSQQSLPRQQPLPTQPSSSSAGSFLDNFVGEPQSVNSVNQANSNTDRQILQPQPQTSTPANLPENKGYINSNKGENLAESLINHINSPANSNPYNQYSDQNTNIKSANSELLSLIQTPPSPFLARFPTSNNQARSRLAYASVSANNGALNVPITRPNEQQRSMYTPQKVALSYPTRSQMQQPLDRYPSRPIVDLSYRSRQQQAQRQASYNGPTAQRPVDPFLMYHAMQTAA